MIIGIVAIAKNYAIGRDGKLPWHYSADLKFFKGTTTGNAVVMGANTWRSIGRPLPNRLNIVLSRSGKIETPDDVVKLNSKQAVIELAKHAKGDIFVIGGAQVYRDLADIIDKWIVTEIPITVDDADTFMPEDFLDKFDLEKTIDLGDELRVKTLHRR